MVDVDRFFSKTTINHSHPDCITWAGCKNPDGYGSYRFNGCAQLAHRVAWQIVVGIIPHDKKVLHKCDNPPCVNPSHLFLGSQGDNIHDMYAKGRGNNVKGARVGTSKLSDGEVRDIRRLYLTKKYSQQNLADRYKVSQPMIGYIVRNEWWK